MTVNSLWELRDWFTLDEAAQQLSTSLGESFRGDEILRLALDGHLKLSVNLLRPVEARCCQDGSLEQDGAEGRPEQRQRIDGLWDLRLTGAWRLQFETAYHIVRGWARNARMDGSVDAILERPGLSCRIPTNSSVAGGVPRTLSSIPDGAQAHLVVRRNVLTEFAANHQAARKAPQERTNKPIGARERATLLTIIAALADATKIDLSKVSKASAAIEALTEALGARVAARTIEEHLKRIPEALERRGD